MSLLALSVAFAAGILSFLSPCIVPMLSVYFSLITGESFRSLRELGAQDAVRRGILRNTLAFVAGFTLVFAAAGAAAAQVGALFGRSLGLLNVIGGLFVLLLGLTTMGVLPQDWLQKVVLRHRSLDRSPGGAGPVSSFLVGVFFAVACSHCIAPTLYSVLLYAGGSGSPVAGAVLMTAFSVGLGIPYVLSGLFLGRTVHLLRQASGARVWAQRVAGALMLLLGIAMLSGKLTAITTAIGKFWSFRPPVGM